MSGAVTGANALDGLSSRAARLAEARVERRLRAIAEAADGLPGVSAHSEDGAVVLEGRGLLERWLRDAGLRDIGRVET